MAGVYLLITSVVISMVTSNSELSNRPFYSDIPGDYCSTRSDPCCLLRKDDCSVPILGTLCYCDEFCNRVVNPDCCPDYARVCQGVIPPPPTPPPKNDCEYHGIQFKSGETIQYNCNTCTCNNGVENCGNERCLIEPELLDRLQQQQALPWTASNYSMFWGRPLKDMILRTGTEKPTYAANKNPIHFKFVREDIPPQFDSRMEWPVFIGPALDQGWCGTSWAFSTSTVASDRFSIATIGKKRYNGGEIISMSTQNLIDCGMRRNPRALQQGCNGGSILGAWLYMHQKGIVDDQCIPNTSGSSSTVGRCTSRGKNQRCTGTSQSSGRLYRTEPAFRIESKEDAIMSEIMTDGPVQAVMKVRQDFFMYRSGIYSHVEPSYSPIEYHSVRLIGWGEESGTGTKYWIAMNSWGPEWGENGAFKIRKGVNESGIEEHILSVRPELGRKMRRRRRRRHGRGGRRHLSHI